MMTVSKIEFFILTIFVVFMISCKEHNKNTFTKEIKNTFTKDLKNISGELMTFDCLVGRPYSMVCYDTLLFICDHYEQKALTVLDIKNNRFVQRGLGIGNGPGEVMGSLKISVSSEQKELYIFQMQSGGFNIYDLSDNNCNLILKESVRIEDRPANAIATRNNLVGIGPFEEGRYHLYDKKGVFMAGIGKYPFSGEKMDIQARFFLYQGYLYAQPNGTRFVLGSSYSDNLEFYEISDSQEAQLIKKYETRNVQAKYNNSVVPDDNCVLGYKGAYGSEKFCYMLYSGRTYAENNHKRLGASLIFVFDWDGNFVKSFQLDNDVMTFCIDEKNNTIYGIVLNEEYDIMKFKM
jgi:hypothetical protein